jgi:DNA-binding IclR family transcriptional regulator
MGNSGTVAVGAPIFDEKGAAIASVSIAGPESRFQGEKLKELIAGIMDTANMISMQLGCIK